MKSTMYEMKNKLEVINRLDNTGEKTNELKGIAIETSKLNKRKP